MRRRLFVLMLVLSALIFYGMYSQNAPLYAGDNKTSSTDEHIYCDFR